MTDTVLGPRTTCIGDTRQYAHVSIAKLSRSTDFRLSYRYRTERADVVPGEMKTVWGIASQGRIESALM